MRITIYLILHPQARFSVNSLEGMLDKFDITVICVVPSYLGTVEDKYKTRKYYKRKNQWCECAADPVPEFTKINKKSRVKNILSYFFGAMGATFKVGKMDYVLSISASGFGRSVGRMGQMDETRQVHL